MSNINCAQTFTIDPATVGNALAIYLSSVELFFKSAPAAAVTLGTTNTSGLANPGVSISIVETVFSVPNLTDSNYHNIARAERANIQTSSDATLPTKFRFTNPVLIDTSKEYAIIVRFDRNAPFVLWKSTQNQYLVTTNTISPGASNKNIGRYYDWFSNSNSDPDDDEFFNNITDFNSNWNYLSDTDLKFRVYCVRYRHGNTEVASNTTIAANVEVVMFGPNGTRSSYSNGSFVIPSSRMEFFTYDPTRSVKESFVGGQMTYQNTVFWPGGYYGGNTESYVATYGNTTVVANSKFSNGASFNWNTVFNSYSGDKWIVICDTNKVNVRKVTNIVDNRTIELDEAVTFSNNLSKFLITPVGRINYFNKSSPFGISETMVMVTDSSSNSSVRFVNNTIESVAVVVAGSGFSNSDKIFIKGYEYISNELEGAYIAIGNVVTNNTGNLVAIYLSNCGCGFTNTANITAILANSTSNSTASNTSAGTGATFSYVVGCTMKTELRANNVLRGCNIINIPISDIIPFFDLQQPDGSSYDASVRARYKRETTANTTSGYRYFIDDANTVISIRMFERNPFYSNTSIPVFMSRSNEFNAKYSNGSVNNLADNVYAGGLELIVAAVSNNDFTPICFNTSPKAIFSKYIINNDYTNEHTDFGNAWARGITNKISFSRPAEDIFVYTTVYRPKSTNIQMYARILNAADPEAFDDKNWTLLEEQSTQRLYSSETDTSDFIEVSWTFPAHPNVQYTVANVVSVTNNSSNLIGIDTTFSSNLASGDLIRIYPTLFPNNNIIAVVNSVTNNTLLTINTPITNNGFLGTTLSIDKLEYKNQAFKNIMNDNVVRYYNSSLVEFDGYNIVQVKPIFLSADPTKIPRIDDIGFIGTKS